MSARQSELTVIVKAKDLAGYVLTATDKSPKRFRSEQGSPCRVPARAARVRPRGARAGVQREDAAGPLAQGVDYLGWHFCLTGTGKVVQRLCPSSKRRLKRRLRKLEGQLAAGEIAAEQKGRSPAGIDGHLRRGDAGSLRKRLLG